MAVEFSPAPLLEIRASGITTHPANCGHTNDSGGKETEIREVLLFRKQSVL